MLRFNLLLTDTGIDPSETRLVRHRHERQYQRLVYQDAIHGYGDDDSLVPNLPYKSAGKWVPNLHCAHTQS